MKPYDQYCPVAHALDLVGERWSLLSSGSCSTGRCATATSTTRLPRLQDERARARLKELEAGGVITRRQAPAAGGVDRLRADRDGAALAPVLAALARWGLRSLGPPPEDLETPPGWLEKALRTTVVADARRSADRLRRSAASSVARSTVASVARGSSRTPTAVVSCTPAGSLPPRSSKATEGAAEIDGDVGVVERLIDVARPRPAGRDVRALAGFAAEHVPGQRDVGLGRARVADREPQHEPTVELRVREEDLAARR